MDASASVGVGGTSGYTREGRRDTKKLVCMYVNGKPATSPGYRIILFLGSSLLILHMKVSKRR